MLSSQLQIVLILLSSTFLPFGQEVSLAQRARSIHVCNWLHSIIFRYENLCSTVKLKLKNALNQILFSISTLLRGGSTLVCRPLITRLRNRAVLSTADVARSFYCGLICVAFFCFLNSVPTNTIDSTNAEKSATGPASNTPIIPKRSGSSRVNGINKKVCLVNANRAPLNDFPIAVKKLEESNCTPFTNTMKR